MDEVTQKPYRVLSLDGGGVRGLYTAAVVNGLVSRFAARVGQTPMEVDVGKMFDMIVGTSTGAILATALAAGVRLDRIIRIYREDAPRIFANPMPSGRLPLFVWLVRNLKASANDPTPLADVLNAEFRDETLEQLYQRRGIAVCLPAVNAENRKSWVFKTPHDTANGRLQRDNQVRLADACLASSAAPIVFPIHQVPYPDDPAGAIRWLVDGGLWANNPIVVALSEALQFAPPDAPIELLSVSTCPPFTSTPLTDAGARRGVLGWLRELRIVETSIDAQAFAYHNIARFLVSALRRYRPIRYIRLDDPPLSGDDAKLLRLDNPSRACLDRLASLAHEAVDINFSKATVATGEDTDFGVLAKLFAVLPTH